MIYPAHIAMSGIFPAVLKGNIMKKFYKTVYQVVVLSEYTPFNSCDLEEINYAVLVGDCSGKVERIESTEVDGPTMANLLMEQGSNLAFSN